MCKAFASKINPNVEKNEAYFEQLIEKVFELRLEQSMGYLPDQNIITPIQFKCLKIVCEFYEKEERVIKLLNNKYLEDLRKRLAL